MRWNAWRDRDGRANVLLFFLSSESVGLKEEDTQRLRYRG